MRAKRIIVVFFLVLISCISNQSVNNAHASVRNFPMNEMISLYDVKFGRKTLLQIYNEDPNNNSAWKIHCLTSRVVVNFPPLDPEMTTVVGTIVWFDALAFISDGINNGIGGSIKTIFVNKNTKCIYTWNTKVLNNWMNKYRYLDQVPYYPRDPRDFYYYVSAGNFAPIWDNPSTIYCRARGAGNAVTGKVYYNGVYTPLAVSTMLTFVSIDFTCTDNQKVYRNWLKSGWKKINI
jgi:hypothetical protein